MIWRDNDYAHREFVTPSLIPSSHGTPTRPRPEIWRDNDYAHSEFVTPSLIQVSQQEALRQRKKDFHVHFGDIPRSESEVEESREQYIVSSTANDAHALGADLRQQPPAQPKNLGHIMAVPS